MVTENQSVLIQKKFRGNQLLKMSIPAYFFPAISAGCGAWITGDSALLYASVTSIAIPSLVATVVSFALLYSCRNYYRNGRASWPLLLSVLLTVLGGAILLIQVMNWWSMALDILLSSTIGAVLCLLKLRRL